MKLLFVEDDETIASGLCYVLESEGYEVLYCKGIRKAEEALADPSIGLALLDISLPDGSGFELCVKIREKLDVPVIFLTAADDEANTVRGLELGADDYVAKPFRLQELLTRIKVVLRRNRGENRPTAEKIIKGELELNLDQGKVKLAGKELHLTPLEYRLLKILAVNEGRILTRGQILSHLWDDGGYYVNDNTLSVNVRRLREKLSEGSGKAPAIRTVRGIGYGMED